MYKMGRTINSHLSLKFTTILNSRTQLHRPHLKMATAIAKHKFIRATDHSISRNPTVTYITYKILSKHHLLLYY